MNLLLGSAEANFHTLSHPSVVNNKQCSHQYPPCNPIKTQPKWDHYDCGSPKSISAGVNYHRVARVQEQSCTLSLIETTPPSQPGFSDYSNALSDGSNKILCPLFSKCSSTHFQLKSSPDGSEVSCDSAVVEPIFSSRFPSSVFIIKFKMRVTSLN